MKKVYFTCSIRGGRDDANIYGELIKLIQQHAEVLSEVLIRNRLAPLGSSDSPAVIYKQNLRHIKKADAVIAEITSPSLGVGYEIAKAEYFKKPILALYRPRGGRRLSATIKGSPGTNVIEYKDIDSLKSIISMFVGQLD